MGDGFSGFILFSLLSRFLLCPFASAGSLSVYMSYQCLHLFMDMRKVHEPLNVRVTLCMPSVIEILTRTQIALSQRTVIKTDRAV